MNLESPASVQRDITFWHKLQRVVWGLILIPSMFTLPSLYVCWIGGARLLVAMILAAFLLSLAGIIWRWGFGVSFLILGIWFGMVTSDNTEMPPAVLVFGILGLVVGWVFDLIPAMTADVPSAPDNPSHPPPAT